jgi:hypothetical protein
MPAGMIDENLSHELRRHTKEMRTVFNFRWRLLHEPEVRLMNQSCALESMVGTFLPQMAPRDATQLFINEGNKDLEGLLIPGSPLAKEDTDRLRRRLGHTHTLGSAKTSNSTAKVM